MLANGCRSIRLWDSGDETEGMVSPSRLIEYTSLTVLLFHFLSFVATCLDSSNLNDIPLFCPAFEPIYFVRISFSWRAHRPLFGSRA
jgi:hypothetical protein